MTSMSEFLKCVDPDDPNKFVLIQDGEIVFYENINSAPTPVTSLTQIGLYDVTAGESFTPSERYKEAPEVFVQPRSIRTVDVNALGIDQSIEIYNLTTTSLGSGRYQISVSGGLKGSAAGYTAVAPLEIYRTNSDDANPTWAVPVSGITEAMVYGYVMNLFAEAYGATLYGISYTFRVGIGQYQSGPDYWGASVTGSHRKVGYTQVSASVSGAAGNYLHIAANLASDGSVVASNSNNVDMAPRFMLLGARCKGGGSAETSNAVFTTVVVGR